MEVIKRIPIKLVFKEYKVTFEYETRKGYGRKQQRVMKSTNRDKIVYEFEEWTKKQRTMSNVQILGIEELKGREQVIEL